MVWLEVKPPPANRPGGNVLARPLTAQARAEVQGRAARRGSRGQDVHLDPVLPEHVQRPATAHAAGVLPRPKGHRRRAIRAAVRLGHGRSGTCTAGRSSSKF